MNLNKNYSAVQQNRARNKRLVTRFYNQILFFGNRVIKGAPWDRCSNELSWFSEAEKRIPGNIPRITNCDLGFYQKDAGKEGQHKVRFYEMERVEGDNLYYWLMENKESSSIVFDKLIHLANSFHKESYEPDYNDIYQMYYLKPKKSLEYFIKVSGTDFNSLRINGKIMENPLLLLRKFYNKLKEGLSRTRYSFIHGDLTMGNTHIDNKGRLFLIDPRGEFGYTKIFGDVRYDVAKMYFSVIGNFESLNHGNFSYSRDSSRSNGHFYNIVSCGFSSYEKDLLEKFGEKGEIIRFIHATIWLSLLPHVSDNKDQQMCSFCYGTELINYLI